MRISEMMDHSSEILEHDMACDFMVDEDRIKQIVFYKIGCSRVKNGRRSKKRYAAIFVATLGIGGMTAWAHSILKSAGEINENKNEVLESQEGVSISENMEEQGETFELDMVTEWIADENLYRDGVPIAKYIMEIPIQKDGTVPECYLDNGAMIIFINGSDAWEINQNTRISFEFMLNEQMDRKALLEVGYLYEGDICQKETVNKKNNTIEMTIPESGKYVVYLRNLSSDRAVITQGKITMEEEKYEKE